jgi:hypothetical protein
MKKKSAYHPNGGKYKIGRWCCRLAWGKKARPYLQNNQREKG